MLQSIMFYLVDLWTCEDEMYTNSECLAQWDSTNNAHTLTNDQGNIFGVSNFNHSSIAQNIPKGNLTDIKKPSQQQTCRP